MVALALALSDCWHVFSKCQSGVREVRDVLYKKGSWIVLFSVYVFVCVYWPGGGTLRGELTLLWGSLRTLMGEALRPVWARSGRTLGRKTQLGAWWKKHFSWCLSALWFTSRFSNQSLALSQVLSLLVSAVWTGARSAWRRGTAAVRVGVRHRPARPWGGGGRTRGGPAGGHRRGLGVGEDGHTRQRSGERANQKNIYSIFDICRVYMHLSNLDIVVL